MKKLFTLSALSLMIASPAFASESSNDWQLEMGAGALNTKAGETVYLNSTGDRKLSKLDWSAKNVPVLKVGLSKDYNQKWSFGSSFWINLTDGDANMTDRDWLSISDEPTHISWHPKTKLDSAYNLDLHAKYWLLETDSGRGKLGLLGGLNLTHYGYDGIGGNASYGNGAEHIVFPDKSVIEYNQNYTSLYFGLETKYKIMDKSEFAASLKYSPAVYATDSDHHKLRDLKFDTDGLGQYLGLSASYTYNFTQQAKVYIEYSYERQYEARTDTTMTNLKDDSKQVRYGSSGMDSENNLVMLGMKYAF